MILVCAYLLTNYNLNDQFMYPVGYQALRVYLSLVPAGAAAANQFATFTCWTQVEQQPLQQPQLIFHIMSMDGSNVTVSGLDPNAAYARLAEQYALRGIALPERGGCRKMHSGEEFFGFTHPTVMRLFQQQQQ
jgi:hypothetical protein